MMNILKRSPRRLLATILFTGLAVSSFGVSSQTVYFHSDVLGSPNAATDENGNLLWTEHYQPFGSRIEKEQAAGGNRQWYTGKFHDEETGLTYLGARLYDPMLGRFMGIDPIGFTDVNPSSFNRYVYANNNPYKYIDPDGTYARGTGFTDAQWKRFDRAQGSAADMLVETANRIDSALASGEKLKRLTRQFERKFGDGTATPQNMRSLAADFRAMAVALQDTGPGGYVANGMNAQQWAAAGFGTDAAASATRPGQRMNVNLDHPDFQDSYRLKLIVGHEAAHNIGKQHGTLNGVSAYRFGDPAHRRAYRDLADASPTEALHNPDHLMDFAE